jgi:hypothetical protein
MADKVEYTEFQTNLILAKVRELRAVGETQQAFQLRGRFERGEYIPPTEYDPAGIYPETPIATDGLKIPRLTGPGSSIEDWAQFAAKVSTIEVEVLRAMKRDEIVRLLKDRHIIP